LRQEKKNEDLSGHQTKDAVSLEQGSNRGGGTVVEGKGEDGGLREGGLGKGGFRFQEERPEKIEKRGVNEE